jgi:hypothetical protein
MLSIDKSMNLFIIESHRASASIGVAEPRLSGVRRLINSNGKPRNSSKGQMLKMTLILLLFPALAAARFGDSDGRLMISWEAPAFGGPASLYIWSYEINGVQDSLTGSSSAEQTSDSSVSLASIHDWAIFSIRAISIAGDTSGDVVSDTAFYLPCFYISGDANYDGITNGLDIIYLANYLKGGPLPPKICPCAPHDVLMVGADANGSCAVNGLDVTFILNHLREGVDLRFCPDCPPTR